jgi:hypothetical protein
MIQLNGLKVVGYLALGWNGGRAESPPFYRLNYRGALSGKPYSGLWK